MDGKKKLKIAVTGGIASGKSEVCRFLEAKKFAVLYADKISKDILEHDIEVIEAIKNKFGEQAYLSYIPNYSFIAKEIFNSEEKLKFINSLLHPQVMFLSEAFMDAALREHQFVFYEAALIFEANIRNRFDKVLLVTSDLFLRKERVLKIGRMNEEEFSLRVKNQINDETKIKLSDYVIENNGSLEDLHLQIEKFLEWINELQ